MPRHNISVIFYLTLPFNDRGAEISENTGNRAEHNEYQKTYPIYFDSEFCGKPISNTGTYRDITNDSANSALNSFFRTYISAKLMFSESSSGKIILKFEQIIRSAYTAEELFAFYQKMQAKFPEFIDAINKCSNYFLRRRNVFTSSLPFSCNGDLSV